MPTSNHATRAHDTEKGLGRETPDLADKAAGYAKKAGDSIERAVDGAEQTVSDLAERGREAGERVQNVAGNMKSALDKSVRSEPMATLAVAAAMGFVIGALWKS